MHSKPLPKLAKAYLLITLMLISIGILIEIIFPRTAPWDQWAKLKPPFYLDTIYRPPFPGEYQSFTNIATISASIDPNSKEVLTTFKYQCLPQCDELWIDFPSKNPELPLEFLAFHRAFITYPQFSISDNQYTLFQKNFRYNTLEEFAQNPPRQTIWTDPGLVSSNSGLIFKSLKNTIPSEEPDYILTTYIKPRSFIGWYEFAKKVSADLIDIGDGNFTITVQHISHSHQDTTLNISTPTIEQFVY